MQSTCPAEHLPAPLPAAHQAPKSPQPHLSQLPLGEHSALGHPDQLPHQLQPLQLARQPRLLLRALHQALRSRVRCRVGARALSGWSAALQHGGGKEHPPALVGRRRRPRPHTPLLPPHTAQHSSSTFASSMCCCAAAAAASWPPPPPAPLPPWVATRAAAAAALAARPRLASSASSSRATCAWRCCWSAYLQRDGGVLAYWQTSSMQEWHSAAPQSPLQPALPPLRARAPRLRCQSGWLMVLYRSTMRPTCGSWGRGLGENGCSAASASAAPLLAARLLCTLHPTPPMPPPPRNAAAAGLLLQAPALLPHARASSPQPHPAHPRTSRSRTVADTPLPTSAPTRTTFGRYMRPAEQRAQLGVIKAEWLGALGALGARQGTCRHVASVTCALPPRTAAVCEAVRHDSRQQLVAGGVGGGADQDAGLGLRGVAGGMARHG